MDTEREVTWRNVYPNKLAHTDGDDGIEDAAWLANAMEDLLAAERRANAKLESDLAAAKLRADEADLDRTELADSNLELRDRAERYRLALETAIICTTEGKGHTLGCECRDPQCEKRREALAVEANR